jgi:hypothetical protein
MGDFSESGEGLRVGRHDRRTFNPGVVGSNPARPSTYHALGKWPGGGRGMDELLGGRADCGSVLPSVLRLHCLERLLRDR